MYFQFCHPFKFYIKKTKIIEDDDSKHSENPEKVEGDVDKKVVKKKSELTSEIPKKTSQAQKLNPLFQAPLNVGKSQEN